MLNHIPRPRSRGSMNDKWSVPRSRAKHADRVTATGEFMMLAEVSAVANWPPAAPPMATEPTEFVRLSEVSPLTAVAHSSR